MIAGACSHKTHPSRIFSNGYVRFFVKYSSDGCSGFSPDSLLILGISALRTAKPHRLFIFPTPFKASMGTLYNISHVLSSPGVCVSVSSTLLLPPARACGRLADNSPAANSRRVRGAVLRLCRKASASRTPRARRLASRSVQNASQGGRAFTLGAQLSIETKTRTADVQTARTRIPARLSCRCWKFRYQVGCRGEAHARPRPPRAVPR